MFYIMHSKRNLRKKNSRRRNRLGGRHPDPPGTRYDNKGRRLPTPPPPPSPPVLRRQNAIVHDLSLQPDAPSPTTSDESSISPASRDALAAWDAARRLDFNVGTGVLKRKNRKIRKSRKSRKSKKSRKVRKNRKQKKTTKRLRR